MLILNKKTMTIPASAAYIGRGSALGNPFAIGVDGDRDKVISDYERYLRKELAADNPIIKAKMLQLTENSTLACYCKPANCHGDIIEKLWRERFSNYTSVRTLFYAGIGSRTAPEEALKLMQRLAARFDDLGFVLRSGGANGSDAAFESGATNKEIFLPWKDFNNRSSQFDSATSEAIRLAEQLHPAWQQLSPAAKKLMARNSHQILGGNLRSPVDFVVTWTPDGAETASQRGRATGGTGQAIDLADKFKIPVFNLKNSDAMARLSSWVRSHPEYIDPAQSTCTLGN